MIKSTCLFAVILMILLSIPAATAITVDGAKSVGEWDEDWAFGQYNASTYNSNGPFGDRMVVRQGTYAADTGLWYDTDPKNDAGPSFSDGMAVNGDASTNNSSGLDLARFYGHYDPIEDKLYGMAEVYGIPGDSDGDGDTGTITPPDANGTAGPVGFGLSGAEVFSIYVSQDSNPANYTIISVTNNDWSVSSTVGLTYGEIDARLTSDAFNVADPNELPKSVYEISIANFSQHYDLSPGNILAVQVGAGNNLDGPGEDSATVFIEIPTPAIDIEKATNGEDADSPTGPYIIVGDLVTWTYNVTNTGNVPLVNVNVTDDMEGYIGTIAYLGVGESNTSLFATGTAAAGQYANNATATGYYGPIEVSDTDPSHYFGAAPAIDIEKATNGEDADSPTGPYIIVGDLVTWTYNVTNIGNVPLVNVNVTDDMEGYIGTIAYLGVGESNTSLFATGTAAAGQYANNATAEAVYDGQPVNDTDPSHYFGAAPAIDIEKATNGEDADSPTGPTIPVGDLVTWTYNVTNIGNVPLVNVNVTDDMEGYIGTIAYLGVGESNTSLFATGTAAAGQYANNATAEAVYDGQSVNDTDPSHYFGAAPAIDIEKATNGEDADSPTGPTIPVGDLVTWTYNVTNIGNVPLVNVNVTDDMEGYIGTIAYLGVGESNTSLFATGTAAAGQYANNATAEAVYDGQSVNDTDPSHYFGAAPAIDIEKATNGEDADSPTGPTIPVGDLVTWTYNVTNIGNVPLVNVNVTDDMEGYIGTIAYLGVGESNTSLFATGTAAAGQYANNATAEAVYDGQPVNDTDPSHYFGAAPAIDIEKATNGEDADSPTGPAIPVGDLVTWTYNVTNIGNVPLVNVNVTDDMEGFIGTIAYLGVGESNTSLFATGNAAAGQYANNATAEAVYDGQPVNDTDPSHYFGAAPAIDIEKATNGEDADSPTGPAIPVGDLVTWTYNVTNIGNVPLVNVNVTDDMEGFIGTIAYLGVGESNTSLFATGNAAAGQYANNATAEAVYDGQSVNDTDPSHYIGTEAPGVGTPGYWKNHPDAWPVEEIEIGNVTYNVSEAIAIMEEPTAKDKTYNMFEQLVAAKLNVLVGNPYGSCVIESEENGLPFGVDFIAEADEWMEMYGPAGSGVEAKSDAWKYMTDGIHSGSDLLDWLDAYNNGYFSCAPHRD
ncbi:hypothetical protein RE476_05950 [Methanolobus mangrovi]|uniref:DUF7507 domain-containing protein n=1 Tax=Methanolobus mangrovi TaxID=3072977 RepID=A0AA51YKL5_9EURY|nr:hypothetical protein [Methanolobus mangrovi]WMW23359.1 hypothetical protein RE476_05950 [Methanolobus mangrovi]